MVSNALPLIAAVFPHTQRFRGAQPWVSRRQYCRGNQRQKSTVDIRWMAAVGAAFLDFAVGSSVASRAFAAEGQRVNRNICEGAQNELR